MLGLGLWLRLSGTLGQTREGSGPAQHLCLCQVGQQRPCKVPKKVSVLPGHAQGCTRYHPSASNTGALSSTCHTPRRPETSVSTLLKSDFRPVTSGPVAAGVVAKTKSQMQSESTLLSASFLSPRTWRVPHAPPVCGYVRTVCARVCAFVRTGTSTPVSAAASPVTRCHSAWTVHVCVSEVSAGERDGSGRHGHGCAVCRHGNKPHDLCPLLSEVTDVTSTSSRPKATWPRSSTSRCLCVTVAP